MIATGNTRVATARGSGPGDVAAAITRLWSGRPIEAAGAVTPAHWRRSHRASQDHPLGNPLPRPDAPERRVRPGRVLEVQPAAGEAPSVHEGPVPEGAIDERAIHVHVRAVEERVVEERTVERRLAKERIVEKRIEAGVVTEPEAKPVAVVGPAVPEAHPVGRVVRVVVGPGRRDEVLLGVVVEVAVGHHALHQVDQRGFLVVARQTRVEYAIVPVVAAHELVELERRDRAGGEHHARPLALVDGERFAVAPAAHLELVAAAHEVVAGRIEREQHPNPTLGVGPQHDEIAVVGQLHVHLGLVAALEITVLIEPDFDRGVVTRCRGRSRGHRRGAKQRCHQGEHHGSYPLYTRTWRNVQETCRCPASLSDLPPSPCVNRGDTLRGQGLSLTETFTSCPASPHPARTGSVRTVPCRTRRSAPGFPVRPGTRRTPGPRRR